MSPEQRVKAILGRIDQLAVRAQANGRNRGATQIVTSILLAARKRCAAGLPEPPPRTTDAELEALAQAGGVDGTLARRLLAARQRLAADRAQEPMVGPTVTVMSDPASCSDETPDEDAVAGCAAAAFGAMIRFHAAGVSAAAPARLRSVAVHFEYQDGTAYDYVLASGVSTENMPSFLAECGRSHWTGSVVRYHCHPIAE